MSETIQSAADQAQRTLVFNLDGTIDPSQLEGLPQEFIERVQSPEFIAEAKRHIELDLAKKKLAEFEAARKHYLETTGDRRVVNRRKVPFTPSTRPRRNPKKHPDWAKGIKAKKLRRYARATILHESKNKG